MALAGVGRITHLIIGPLLSFLTILSGSRPVGRNSGQSANRPHNRPGLPTSAGSRPNPSTSAGGRSRVGRLGGTRGRGYHLGWTASTSLRSLRRACGARMLTLLANKQQLFVACVTNKQEQSAHGNVSTFMLKIVKQKIHFLSDL